MTTINVYLYFNGNCEEAFRYYKSVFNKEFQYIGYYKDISEVIRQNFPNCKDEHVMHVALPISKETILMGADLIDLNRTVTISSNKFSLFVSVDDIKEADRLFNGLSNKGVVKLPMSTQYWGSYYGICVDQFGVSWKISCSVSIQVIMFIK
ncbi:VOC family protein [Wenyingzhuangia sp. chi5]|uniref:VOC family protein n=1 Tax=Wenyingzhuangia gilva TaxID=3057677 RepID=A0ABT8VTR5_9FLAO|nr:VOC family protein [Wenyingzhuangia sp. chi5]MDO3695363.1 VOC family protein [Wenyingzhuangia sp. chi5]